MPSTNRTTRNARSSALPRRTPSRETLLQALAAMDMGDRSAEEGDRRGALAYYGSALDTYLAEGLLGMARTVAERMVARYPDVVRARMTLAVVGLAEALQMQPAGDIRSTCPGMEEYVLAVRLCGQEEMAVRHLRRLAGVTQSAAVRERIAEFLTLLEDPAGAEEVLRSVHSRPASAAELLHEQSARWMEVLLSPVATS